MNYWGFGNPRLQYRPCYFPLKGSKHLPGKYRLWYRSWASGSAEGRKRLHCESRPSSVLLKQYGPGEHQDSWAKSSFRGRPESSWTGSVSLSLIPSFGAPASSILYPGHYLKWSLHCGKTLMTKQRQETWSRILAPPLVSYGAINTLLNLSEPVSPCVKWLWSAYVLRVLWGLSKVYYLEKLLENSRCLMKCQTQGKTMRSI